MGDKLIRRVVLVNPYYQNLTQSIAQITVGPPLGLAYIAAVSENKGYAVDIVDANAERLSVKKTVDRITEFKADIVGLTAVTPTVGICAQIAEELKGKDRLILTVIGGIHATVLPEETMKECLYFDFLIRGEGDLAFVELLDALNRKLGLSSVKGLVYREFNKIIINAPQISIENLDKLPFPARHLLKNSLYRTFDSDKMTCVIAMRGCPAKCIYCAVNLVSGQKCRKRSPFNVIEEIRLCVFKYNTRFIAFLDDTFTFDKNWVHGLCDEFIKTGLNKRLRWSCLTRVDNIDSNLLKHMKQAGCTRVEFGIESGSEKILEYLKKGINIRQIKEAFSAAKKIGLSTMGFVILNVPGETKETIAETKRLIMELDPDFLQLSFATPYPGTELFELCVKDNLLMSKDWSKYIFLNYQIIKNNLITEDEFKKLMRDIQLSFYLRPKHILNMWLYAFKNLTQIKVIVWAGKNAFKKLYMEGRNT